MKPAKLLIEFKEIASQLGFQVRNERGGFRGGRCVVNGEEQILLNKRHPIEAQIVVLAEALKELPIDSIFIAPAIRSALEEAWTAFAAVSDQMDRWVIDRSDNTRGLGCRHAPFCNASVAVG